MKAVLVEEFKKRLKIKEIAEPKLRGPFDARKDLQDTLQLAARGLVKCNYTSARMEDINDVFDEMRAGKIDGRIVLEIA